MTITSRPLPPPRALPPSRLPGRARDARLATNATLIARDDATDSLAAFTLERDEPLAPFAAGQYVSVGIVDGGQLLQRPYSVVSLSRGGRFIELLVKRLADGALSPRLWRLVPGSRLRVGPARGLFSWTPDNGPDHVFVAAGTGIAPFIAMLNEAREESGPHRITLVHAVSYADELLFGRRIDAIASDGLEVVYRPSVSRPNDPRNAAWQGVVGRAEDLVRRLVVDPAFDRERLTVYLCGGGAMVEECSRIIVEHGLPTERILTEKFHLATSTAM